MFCKWCGVKRRFPELNCPNCRKPYEKLETSGVPQGFPNVLESSDAQDDSTLRLNGGNNQNSLAEQNMSAQLMEECGELRSRIRMLKIFLGVLGIVVVILTVILIVVSVRAGEKEDYGDADKDRTEQEIFLDDSMITAMDGEGFGDDIVTADEVPSDTEAVTEAESALTEEKTEAATTAVTEETTATASEPDLFNSHKNENKDEDNADETAETEVKPEEDQTETSVDDDNDDESVNGDDDTAAIESSTSGDRTDPEEVNDDLLKLPGFPNRNRKHKI